MSIKQRLLLYLDNQGITKYAFYKKTNLGNGYLDKTNEPHMDKLEKILLCYENLNREWLLHGNGEMLIDVKKRNAEALFHITKNGLNNTDFTKLINDKETLDHYNALKVAEPNEPYGNKFNPQPKPKAENKGVPIYDFDFAAGLSMFSTNDIQLSEHIMGFMNFPEFMGADAIVKIKGDSMTGKLEDGDWVSVRKQKSVDIINYGSIYGIITTDDMPLIKIIRKGTTDDTVLLRSTNPEYEDYEIPKAKIQALFQFLGKATIKGITN